MKRHGQILIELLIAIAVGVTLAVIGTQLVSISLQSSQSSKESAEASGLTQEALEGLRAITRGNSSSSQGWNHIYLPPDGTGNASTSKGAANPYHVEVVGNQWRLATGTEAITVANEVYTRTLIIENVSRDSVTGGVEAVYEPTRDDPSTQKIAVTVSKSGMPDVTLSAYITRHLNEATLQTDWSGSQDNGPFSATSTVTNLGTDSDPTSTTLDITSGSCSGGGACAMLKQL